MPKKTLVIGASVNPERYSNMAMQRLRQKGNEVVAIGLRDGIAHGIKIETSTPARDDIHTVTLYVSAKNQKRLYDYIISLKPERIIFNPGAENEELQKLAEENGIETIEACTLVMLSIGDY